MVSKARPLGCGLGLSSYVAPPFSLFFPNAMGGAFYPAKLFYNAVAVLEPAKHGVKPYAKTNFSSFELWVSGMGK